MSQSGATDEPPIRSDDEIVLPANSLESRTLITTRAEAGSPVLQKLLGGLGARTISVPTIRFAPPEDPRPLRDALLKIRDSGTKEFTWILFTSSTGVRFFFELARELEVPEAVWLDFRFGVVGPTTASQLASVNLKTERIVIGSRAETLADLLVGVVGNRQIPEGSRCLLPQAQIARADLQKRLRPAGVHVEEVIAYRTIPESADRARPFFDLLDSDDGIDGLTFASPSAFESFLAMTAPRGEAAIRERPIPIFTIGPTTSNAVRDRGFVVASQASPFTANGLVHAIVEYFQSRRGSLEADHDRDC